MGEEVSVSLGAPQLGGCKLGAADATLSPLGGVCVERKTSWKKLNQDLYGQHLDLAVPEAARYPVSCTNTISVMLKPVELYFAICNRKALTYTHYNLACP